MMEENSCGGAISEKWENVMEKLDLDTCFKTCKSRLNSEYVLFARPVKPWTCTGKLCVCKCSKILSLDCESMDAHNGDALFDLYKRA